MYECTYKNTAYVYIHIRNNLRHMCWNGTELFALHSIANNPLYIWIYTYVYIYTRVSHYSIDKIYNICTGYRRLIGSPKLQIIFHKRATKYRSLLRKWPIKIRNPVSLRHPVCITPTNWHMTETRHTTWNQPTVTLFCEINEVCIGLYSCKLQHTATYCNSIIHTV